MKWIVAHPNSIAVLARQLRIAVGNEHCNDAELAAIAGFARLQADEFIREFARVWWVFPVEPFVEYEPKDEVWCRFFGIGHEDGDRLFYEVNEGSWTSRRVSP